MEQHQKLDEFEEYLDNREIERTLFVKIWSAPRTIFRFIHENKYEKYMWLLLILAGISNGFDRASRENMGDTGSLAKIVVISILVGGLLGWISYYIYSALVSWIGQLFKGKADVKAIVRVMAYGSVPSIAALVMLVPQMIVYGKEMFTSNPDYDG
ncbi:MAG TPA: Yip1 family protein, partial [Flavobacterium sp.]|nr:Yip1 family protein [Flavobacterium sp.]